MFSWNFWCILFYTMYQGKLIDALQIEKKRTIGIPIYREFKISRKYCKKLRRQPAAAPGLRTYCSRFVRFYELGRLITPSSSYLFAFGLFSPENTLNAAHKRALTISSGGYTLLRSRWLYRIITRQDYLWRTIVACRKHLLATITNNCSQFKQIVAKLLYKFISFLPRRRSHTFRFFRLWYREITFFDEQSLS